MRINSKAYGPVDIDERQEIYFPRGIIGFEQFKRYALLDAAQQPRGLDVDIVTTIFGRLKIPIKIELADSGARLLAVSDHLAITPPPGVRLLGPAELTALRATEPLDYADTAAEMAPCA